MAREWIIVTQQRAGPPIVPGALLVPTLSNTGWPASGSGVVPPGLSTIGAISYGFLTGNVGRGATNSPTLFRFDRGITFDEGGGITGARSADNYFEIFSPGGNMRVVQDFVGGSQTLLPAPGNYSYNVIGNNASGDGNVTNFPVQVQVNRPVVQAMTVSLTLPVTNGQLVGTIQATNNPTSYGLSGSGATLFSVSGTGAITVANAAAITATTYNLTISASNFGGTGTASATFTVSSVGTITFDTAAAGTAVSSGAVATTTITTAAANETIVLGILVNNSAFPNVPITAQITDNVGLTWVFRARAYADMSNRVEEWVALAPTARSYTITATFSNSVNFAQIAATAFQGATTFDASLPFASATGSIGLSTAHATAEGIGIWYNSDVSTAPWVRVIGQAAGGGGATVFTDGGFSQNFGVVNGSFRVSIPTTIAGRGFVQLQFKSGFGPLSLDHVSMGIQSSGANTTTIPTEVTFNTGLHGFNVGSGVTVTSDAIAFNWTSGQTLIVCMDFTNVNGNTDFQSSNAAVTAYNVGGATYNSATMTNPNVQVGINANLSQLLTSTTTNFAAGAAASVFMDYAPFSTTQSNVHLQNSPANPGIVDVLALVQNGSYTTYTVSPSNTVVPPAAQIIDDNYNFWTLSGGKIFANNVQVPGTSGTASLILWYQNNIFYQNSAAAWFEWFVTGSGSSETASWLPQQGDPRGAGSPITFPVSGVSVSGAQDPGSAYGGKGWRPVSEFAYWANTKHYNVIRVPVLWETLQPVLSNGTGAIDTNVVSLFSNYCGVNSSCLIILDVHQFGPYYPINSTQQTGTTFANFWGKLATAFKGFANIGFALCNEPVFTAPSGGTITNQIWRDSYVNPAIAAIRTAGATSQPIFIDVWGTWTGAWTIDNIPNDTISTLTNAQVFGGTNGVSNIVDPNNNFYIELHQFLDNLGDGGATAFPAVDANIGIMRIQRATNWARAWGYRLLLGEFGTDNQDPTSVTATTNMLKYMAANSDVWQAFTGWWTGDASDVLSLSPTNYLGTGTDAAGEIVLEQNKLPAYVAPSGAAVSRTAHPAIYVNGLTTNVTFGNIVVPTGLSSGALIVTLACDSNPGTVTAIWDFGGTAQVMTEIANSRVISGNAFAATYGLAVPTVGQKSLHLTFQNAVTHDVYVSGMCVNNVGAIGSWTAATSSGTNAFPTIGISTIANQSVSLATFACTANIALHSGQSGYDGVHDAVFWGINDHQLYELNSVGTTINSAAVWHYPTGSSDTLAMAQTLTAGQWVASAICPPASGSGSIYVDGFAARPANVAAQFPTLLNSYGGRNARMTGTIGGRQFQPPWNVAGVDYGVGCPGNITLKDASVQANLPTGATANAGTRTVTIGSPNVTLDGYQFPANWVLTATAGPTTVQNCKFVLTDPTVRVVVFGNSGNLTLKYCEFDGGKITTDTASQNSSCVIYNPSGVGTFTMQYCYMHGMSCDGYSSGAGTVTCDIRFNLISGLGYSSAGSNGHPDPYQLLSHTNNNSVVAFNTIYEPADLLTLNPSLAKNPLLDVEAQLTGIVNNQIFANNTLIAIGPGGTTTNAVNSIVFGSFIDDTTSRINGITVIYNFMDMAGTVFSQYLGSPNQGQMGVTDGNAYVLEGNVGMPDASAQTSNINYVTAGTTTTARIAAPTLQDVNVITGLSTSPATGTFSTGSVITFTVPFFRKITVTGAAPQLVLSNGARAVFTSGSGTSTLTFTYTVAAGDAATSNLATGASAFSGGTLTDQFGNPVITTGANSVTFTGLNIGTTATVAPIVNPAGPFTNISPSFDLKIANLTFSGTGGTPTSWAIQSPPGDAFGAYFALYLQGAGNPEGNTVGSANLRVSDGTTTGLSHALPPAASYPLSIRAANAGGTSPAVVVNVSVLGVPTVTAGANPYNITLPVTAGQTLAPAVSATNGPITSWALTPASNPNAYWGIDNTGTIYVTAEGAGLAPVVTGSQAFTATIASGGLISPSGVQFTGDKTGGLPTSWAIVSGNPGGIVISTNADHTGSLAYGTGALPARGSYSLGLAASNAGGTSPTVTVAVTAISAPIVSSVVSSPVTGTVGSGGIINFTITFNQVVTVVGTPTLSLLNAENPGDVASYVSGSGTTTLVFRYTAP